MNDHTIHPFRPMPVRILALFLVFILFSLCMGGCQPSGNHTSPSFTTPTEETPAPKPNSVTSIDQGQAIVFQPQVGQRYSLETPLRAPHQIYDSVTGTYIDPSAQLLGDLSSHLDTFFRAVEEAAAQTYPGSMDTENNRQLLREYLLPGIYYQRVVLDYDAMAPDTGFISNMPDYKNHTKQQLKDVFFGFVWNSMIYAYEKLGDAFLQTPLWARVLGVDSASGICFLQVRDIPGNGLSYLIYDIQTNTSKEISIPMTLGDLSTDGAAFTISESMEYAIVTTPDWVNGYNGDCVYLISLETGEGQKIKGARFVNGAISRGYFSPEENVVYYRLIDSSADLTSIRNLEDVIKYKSQYQPSDEDQWMFHMIPGGSSLLLSGKFVRFLADETIVLMESGGVYRAFSIKEGDDVTAKIVNGEISLEEKDKWLMSIADGQLQRKNPFTGEISELNTPADTFLLSRDGAYCISWCLNADSVTLTDVATGQSRSLPADPQLCSQLFSAKEPNPQLFYDADADALVLRYRSDASPVQ